MNSLELDTLRAKLSPSGNPKPNGMTSAHLVARSVVGLPTTDREQVLFDKLEEELARPYVQPSSGPKGPTSAYLEARIPVGGAPQTTREAHLVDSIERTLMRESL